MKKRNGMLCVLVLLAIIFLLPDRAMACACCSEPGEYNISFSKMSDYELDVLRRLRFGKTGYLFTTAADLEEDAKGIATPSEKYALMASLVGNLWKFSFRDGTKSGSLSLPLPLKMLNYRVDIDATPESINPSLYKEWRFEGRVNGTGIFRDGTAGVTKYFLVLQGHGNNCDGESDFTNWRLEITGKRARFAFYGDFQKEPAVTKHLKGTFDVKMSPQPAEVNVGDPSIGRMSLDKKFHGTIEATSI